MTTEDNQTQPHPISDRQLLAIDALLSGATHNEAAEIAGVHRCTVTGWANHHIGFIAELNQRRHHRNKSSADLLHSLIHDALQLLNRAVNEGDVRTALMLLTRLDLKTMWKIGLPKAVTPLAVITNLAREVDSDILMDLMTSSKSIELVEKQSIAISKNESFAQDS